MATIPALPLFTSGPLKSGSLNRLRDVIAFWQNPPAANIRASASQDITSGGSYQLVTFQTTEYDTDTIVTSTTRLTCKTAGRYRVAATATFSANGTGERYIVIRKNAAGSPTGGTQVISATAKPSAASSCTVSTNSALEVQLSVNDTIEAFAFQDSGATLTLNFGPGDTFLTMRLASATASLSGEEATNIADALAESSLGTSDLDAVLAPGNYVQGTAADATLARHYPVETVTGHLQVTSDGLASPALVSQRWVTSGTNDVYVRTFSSAAWSAWELVGGSSGIPFRPLGVYSGKYTTIGTASGSSNSPAGSGAEVFYVPFTAGTSITLSGLVIEITTAAAGATPYVALYAHDTTTGWPGARLVTGTVDGATAGIKELTVSQAIVAGTTYWLAVGFNASGVAFRGTSGDIPNIPMTSIGSFLGAAEQGGVGGVPPASASPTTMRDRTIWFALKGA